jgi:transcriptional regulator with XRE-family HTH domain
MSNPSPTVRSRRLRSELRRLRAERGLTIEQVSERTGKDITTSALSRWETGERHVRTGDLGILLDLYGVTGEQREELLTLGREARRRGWWQSYRGDTVPEWFHVYLGLESEASFLHGYEAELVPGLLQTPEYYAAFLHAAPAAGDDATIEQKLAVRGERQQRLDADDAPQFWVVLNEAVIRRQVGNRSVMAAQLDHIITMAQRPQVNVQVLPFRAGAHQAMEGSFMLLGFPDPSDPDVGYVEYGMGSLIIESPPQVDRFSAMFDHLRAQALGPEESIAQIRRAAAELA